MELENNFEFISPEVIRIKGTRVDIDVVIEEFLTGKEPAEIQKYYPRLTLEQIYATITYYLLNKQEMEAYLEIGREMERKGVEEQRRNPHPGIQRILKFKAEREAANAGK